MARWPISDEAAREMYVGGRGNETARWWARLWVRVFLLGLLPRRWVILEVRGRKTGRTTSFPLGMADVHRHWYVVSMLGECSWVANVRAAGGNVVLRRRCRRRMHLVEIPVERRGPILRRYVEKVPGGRPHIPVRRGAPEAEFARIASGYPVFEVCDAVQPTMRASQTRPLLGLRRTPGRLALAVFRMPPRLYRGGRGWMLGRTFLLLEHVGRKTGDSHDTVAMVVGDDAKTSELVICSAWGPDVDWIRNLRAGPARQIRIGRRSFVPEHRFLSEDEAVSVAVTFRGRHPRRLWLLSTLLGWGDLRSEDAVSDFVSAHPFVAFRPSGAPKGST